MPRKRSYSSPQTHGLGRRRLLVIDAEMERKLPKDLERVEESETETEEEEEEEITARPKRKLKTSKISTDVSRRAANMHPDLYMAAKRGDIDFIKNLIAEDMERPVLVVDLVLKTKYSEIADFLVETNPEASHCLNQEHKSPLYMAAEAGDAEMVKLMIEKTDGIIMAMVDAGDRILLPSVKLIAHSAITVKNIDVLDSVMSEKPHRIKDRDGEGMTPLSYAASIGYLQEVCYFLNKFADYIYESDQNGFFPIHTASSRGHIKIVQEFIQRCPDSFELLNH
ncbi:hypothetical protein SO802_019505 [Lithocarpus litseifolius]|uniref:Uncharacterized protein n=1 Tax=Lithocarpus litseifolius TaxID=425828 RepID=A0AAW2CR67_9ROSI